MKCSEKCIHQYFCKFKEEGSNCDYYEEERLHGKWEYLKEHIIDMRDADGELNQKDTCQFILNLMGVIEREGEKNE